jgi:eukaryotic-like serine/threonine-protein kinase
MAALSDAVLDHLSELVDAPSLAGTRYRLLGFLGRGGMGSVYLAVDRELDREVALKVVSGGAPSADYAQRLVREARIVAQLEHPGIVPVHDIGVLDDGRAYYVMKLVRGKRLDDWLEGQIETRGVLRMFQRICEAVAFAHAHGVVHRDLKPANVMVGAFGEALVMDWGIAKHLEGAHAPDPSEPTREVGVDASLDDTVPAPSGLGTMEGTVMGTPGFMAPEQARGEIGAITARSDVYGLGAILYYVLLRQPPPRDPASVALTRRGDRTLDGPLLSICAKAMAHDPERRYASAMELSEDIGCFLDGLPVSAHRESLAERAGRLASRHRVVLSLLAAYLIVRTLLALLP